ncbi:unnamed protein product [Rhizoctonia solani]|uniref:Protein kinase domain-containing protein n=1 Tax=Rhizoctonia solani TaxID=456999 RepID=A0A8H2Y1H5_9AGAM|nr:unnamed protein product [Rhizoctonia solani]
MNRPKLPTLFHKGCADSPLRRTHSSSHKKWAWVGNFIRFRFISRKDAKRMEDKKRTEESQTMFVPTACQSLSESTEFTTPTAPDLTDIEERSPTRTIDSLEKSPVVSGSALTIEKEPLAEIPPTSVNSYSNTIPATPFSDAKSAEDDLSKSNISAANGISREMSASEVISLLVEHGCLDITSALQIPAFKEHPVSHGGFGDIFYGELSNGKRVAVKALRISAGGLAGSPTHFRQAARELHIWSKCNHPNVMPLLGLAVFRGRIGMVSPWLSNGNLPNYLETARGVNRHQLCVEICEGLSYLHEIGIVHGDMKGANVLISEKGTPVLIDFGNSTLREQTLKFTQPRSNSGLTVRWSALELLKGISTHNEASDVYALGMTIYEVIAVMEQRLPRRPVTLPIGQKYGEEVWNLLISCWSPEPSGRPQAKEIVAAMRELVSI